MDQATIDVLEAAGHTVLRGHAYMVVDHGDVNIRGQQFRHVVGLDESGEPVAFGPTACIVIPAGKPCKIYRGPALAALQARMLAKNPHAQNGTISDAKDIATAAQDGDILGVARGLMRTAAEPNK